MKRPCRESACCRAPIETRMVGELPVVGGGSYSRVATRDVCTKCGYGTREYESPPKTPEPTNPNQQPKIPTKIPKKRRKKRKRVNNNTWKVERARAMAKTGGMCTKCPSKADVVHHKIPVCVSPELQYTQSNLEPLCTPCHRKEHPDINPALFTTRLLTTL